MDCKFALRIDNFPFRLCMLQHGAPVGCNIISMDKECQILKEYNIDTSALHSNKNEDIVRTI